MDWVPLLLAALLIAPAGSSLLAVETETSVWIWSGGKPPELLLGLDHHQYPNLGMAAFIGTSADAARIQAAGGSVVLNERFELHLDRSVPAIEADRVSDEVGYQRNGPSVLVVDTGVDSTHPDFQAGNLPVNIAADRVGGLVRGILEPDVVIDEAGHGTHVAGIVAGSGESLGDADRLHGRFEGVYHTGRIIGFQALATDTQDPAVDTAAALEAFEWAITNKDRYEVRVVQNSWGLPGDLDTKHPVNQATLQLYLEGITVVFSAGNRGNEANSLNRHCLAPWVLCVGATDNDGNRLEESSIGRPGGASYAHPDLVAPGETITAPGSVADLDLLGTIGNVLELAPSNELYQIRSGTSMAAPHVSGVAALLAAANPALSPDQLMDILVESAIPLSAPVYEVGAGMLNARTAYNLAVQTTGNRAEFEAGQQVKYAGARSGDPTNAADSISVGYTDTPTGGPVLAPPAEPLFAGYDPIAVIGAGIGVLLVFVLLVAIVVAIARR